MPAPISSSNRKRPARISAATIAVGTASVFVLSGCASSGKVGAIGGTGAKTPVEALAASVTNITAGKSESFEINFQPDAAAIASMSKDSAPGEAAITKKLLENGGLSVKVQVSADKPLKDLSAADAPNTSASISLGGKDYLDIVSVAGALYLKADVPDALKLAGVPDSVVSGEISKLPPAVQTPANAAIAGKWLTISAADLKSLQSLATLGGGDNTPATGSAPNAGQVAQFTQALMSALTKDTTVTDKGNGQFTVSGKAKTVGQDILQALQPMMNSVPATSKKSLTKLQDELAKSNDQTPVTFDVWVKNGSLSEVKIDVAQFAKDSGGGHAALDLKLTQNTGDIKAPSGAVTLDVKGLISSFGAGL